MNDDALADRRRATEDDYFRKRDQQLIDNMRMQTEEKAARQRLSQRVGVADETLLQRIEAIGFSDESVPLLHMLPLIDVAWIEGTPSPGVVARITTAARDYGVDASSNADRRLHEWLGRRPSDVLFNEALQVISAIIRPWTAVQRERYVQTLLERCTEVAAASGGVLGFGKISRRERELLDRIRETLEEGLESSHPSPTRRGAGGPEEPSPATGRPPNRE
jgi:hypothetical protein